MVAKLFNDGDLLVCDVQRTLQEMSIVMIKEVVQVRSF